IWRTRRAGKAASTRIGDTVIAWPSNRDWPRRKKRVNSLLDDAASWRDKKRTGPGDRREWGRSATCSHGKWIQLPRSFFNSVQKLSTLFLRTTTIGTSKKPPGGSTDWSPR